MLTQISDDINILEPDNDCLAVTLLPRQVQKSVEEIMNMLGKRLPDIVWTMPRDALHITLCQIIEPKSYKEDKDKLYRENHTKYESCLAETLKNIAPIKLYFDTIEASPQAIILKSKNIEEFNSIRRQLVDSLPFPKETKPLPDIVHSTIARYMESVDIEQIRNVTDRIHIDISATISEFKLLRFTSPHLINYQVIRSYDLKS